MRRMYKWKLRYKVKCFKWSDHYSQNKIKLKEKCSYLTQSINKEIIMIKAEINNIKLNIESRRHEKYM